MELRTSTLIRDQPIGGKGQREFSYPDAGEAQMTSGPFQETSKTAITVNPESNFTRREKNHSLFH